MPYFRRRTAKEILRLKAEWLILRWSFAILHIIHMWLTDDRPASGIWIVVEFFCPILAKDVSHFSQDPGVSIWVFLGGSYWFGWSSLFSLCNPGNLRDERLVTYLYYMNANHKLWDWSFAGLRSEGVRFLLLVEFLVDVSLFYFLYPICFFV